MWLGSMKHNTSKILEFKSTREPVKVLGIFLGDNQGRVRLGIFRNKNVFRNIFRLFCSWEQNSQNGIQVFRNENSSQTNAYLHYSNYS